MAIDPQRVQQLFLEIVSLPNEQRDEILERETGTNTELRRRVAALLQAHDAPESFLDRASNPVAPLEPDPLTEFASPPESSEKTFTLGLTAEPGQVIAGRYTLQERIGEGGMGDVWVARQSEPVKRKVALKLIKAGMDSRAVINRFEQERQALAIMDHPNIARVLDGGVTQAGRPFFVMELVNGLPLTRFCDEAKLTPAERLELFLPICKAVQHAHQKGIVHRDLKPANILVTLVDGQPVPKVIDFGVAKAIGGKLTEVSLSTQFGAVVGTLEYMSPEQAGYSAVDVDTRSDIYSLGVILYELLTGLRPIDARRLQQAGLAEMIRLIQEEDPARPSTRCSTDATFPSLAALRRTEPKKLTALLRGELDWVIMKCLEKQRDRRYDSATGLARDIQRILAHEPVEARPPSVWYRGSKVFARHRGLILAAGLLLTTLILGLGGTTWGLVRAEHQRRRAETAKEAETRRAAEEQKAKQELAVRLRQVEASNTILLSIFSDLNPEHLAEQDRPIQMVLADHLDQAIQDLQGNRVGDPEVVARIQQELGHTLVLLGRPEKGLKALTQGLDTLISEFGPDDPRTWTMKNSLAGAYLYSGHVTEAITIHEEIYGQALAALGPDDPQTINHLANLGATYQTAGQLEKARPLLQEAAQRFETTVGPDADSTLLCLNNLATTYGVDQQKSHAIPLLEKAYRLTREKRGPDHLKTYLCMINLASSYHAAMEDDKARPLLEEAYQRTRRELGPEHPTTVVAMQELAELYLDLDQIDLVLPLLEQEAKRCELKYGPHDPRTFKTQNQLAVAFWKHRDYDRSIALLEELLRREELTLGRQHATTLVTLMNLGSNYMDTQQPQRARLLLEEAYQHSDDHPNLLECASRLATLHAQQGSTDLAISLLEEAYPKTVAAYGENSPQSWEIDGNLATQLYRAQRLDLSIPRFRDLLARQETLLSSDHPLPLTTRRNLAINLQASGEDAEAAEHFQAIVGFLEQQPERYPQLSLRELQVNWARSLANLKQTQQAIELLESSIEHYKTTDPDSRVLATALANLASIHWRSPNRSQCLPLYLELLDWNQNHLDEDDPEITLANWNVATNYAVSGQYPQAIRYFEAALAQINKDPAAEFPPTRQRLLESLVQCHVRMNQPEKAVQALEEHFAATEGLDAPITEDSFPLRRILAVMHFRSQQPDQAIPILKELLEFESTTHHRDSQVGISLLADLGLNYQMAGDLDEAIRYLEEALKNQDRLPAIVGVQQALLDCYQQTGRYAQAVTLLQRVVERTRKEVPANSPLLANHLAGLSLNLLKLKRYDEAEPLIRECLKIREANLPNDWSTANTRSMLGEVLLAQGKLDEAEPLLRVGYEGLQAKAAAIPAPGLPRVAEAIERLIRFAEKREQPDEIAHWRGVLDEWNQAHPPDASD